ncbi:glutathione transferase GstA [Methylobacterium dankookense]|uniref:Glutathione S-transferase GST-6.0 n=1 Tax=Methylobacterium dankookense TaxID=560405 RepID=A0A564FZ76_9HYPH|nr:glutathione transferase GstA [Methylobacterium dankookense]GJD58493.1 Glutathione S-transferase GST-6.0 [Methylobacterium dankookense]VUF13174.1 Glutathione S-transferase GST-6.0 [Methylobacterium dankookense]
MKLFYAPGACSLSPHIVLREIGLPFALEAVDLKSKTTESGADFTAINPKGYVPALQLEDGEVLTEGAAIVQYLADRHAPGTLAPVAGTVERARLNGHLNFISAELHKAFGPLFNPALAPEAREAAVANLGRKLDVVEAALADGRPFLTGADFTVADVYLFVVLSWAPHLGIDLGRWPHLGAFSQRVSTRAAVQTALAAEGLQKAA